MIILWCFSAWQWNWSAIRRCASSGRQTIPPNWSPCWTSTCDVQVLDYNMPGGRYGDGLVLLSHLRRRYRELRLVLYTMVDNPALLLAIVKQGTSGVVSKSDSLTHLVDAVHAAHGGRQYYSPTIKDMLLNSMMVAEPNRLTPREAEIVRLFCAGSTITEIAERLHRSVQTVSTQKRSAMRKLGVSRDVDLIKMYTGGV